MKTDGQEGAVDATWVDAAFMDKVVEAIGAITRQREVLAREATVAPCPRCGAPTRTAEWHWFRDADGMRERLVARCDAGHEWAVGDAGLRWVNSDALFFAGVPV